MKKMVNLVEFENQLDLGAPNGNVDDGLVLMLCVVRMKKCQQLSMQCDFKLILWMSKQRNSPKAQVWT